MDVLAIAVFVALPAVSAWVGFDLRFRFWRHQVREVIRDELQHSARFGVVGRGTPEFTRIPRSGGDAQQPPRSSPDGEDHAG